MNSIIENIKKQSVPIYFCLCGGGSGSVTKLCEDGGASNVFLGAKIPYAQSELEKITGPINKAVSLDTCKRMMSNEHKQGQLTIVSTASLAKPNQREDRMNHAYVGIDDELDPVYFRVVFNPKSTRLQQENDLSNYILINSQLYNSVDGAISSIHEYTKSIESLFLIVGSQHQLLEVYNRQKYILESKRL